MIIGKKQLSLVRTAHQLRLVVYFYKLFHSKKMALDERSLQFKFGVFHGVVLMLLMFNAKCLRKPRIAKIPFFVQLLWLLNFLCWDRAMAETDAFKIQFLNCLSATLDLITKIIVVYFLSIRILVVGNLLTTKRERNIWIAVFSFGVITSTLGNLNGFLTNKDTPESFKQLLNACYYSNEIFISCVETATVWIYLRVKFRLTGFSDLVKCLRELKLENIAKIICLFAVINVLTFLLNIFWLDFDPDLNFCGMLSAIKYHYACKMSLVLFKKTMGFTANEGGTEKGNITRGCSANNLQRLDSHNQLSSSPSLKSPANKLPGSNSMEQVAPEPKERVRKTAYVNPDTSV